jgi:hypothetical protein
MKNRYISIITVVLISITCVLSAQTISKIKSVVVGNNIEVQYVVKGLKLNQTLTVSLYVSSDGGSTFQGPMLEVKGDVGEKIFNGPHSITWEAMKEMSFGDVNAVFDIRAVVVSEKIKKNWFVAYSGNLVTPIGIRVGTLGGVGWYIAGQSNTKPGLTGSYTYKDGTITDYTPLSWYEFTSKHVVSAYTVFGGVTWQVARKFFLYGGAGYGKEEVLYEINEYSYDGNAPLGTDYAKDSDNSAKGIAVEAGLLFKTGKIVIIGGASSVAFKIPNWQAGIGYSF